MIAINKRWANFLYLTGIVLVVVAILLSYVTDKYKLALFIMCPGSVFMIPRAYLFYNEEHKRNKRLSLSWAVQFGGLIFVAILLFAFAVYSLMQFFL